jgi:HTH-type transcriptional regulator / antitoxin HigA
VILNDRQLKIISDHRDDVATELSAINPIELVKLGVDPVIVEAQKRSLQSRLSKLDADIDRYRQLRSEGIRALMSASASDIGVTLVEARIARGFTQRELALRLGCHEQQVQRYEHDLYKAASISKVREVMKALEIGASFNILNEPNAPAIPLEGRFSVQTEAFARFPIKEMKKRNWFTDIGVRDSWPNTDAELAESYVRSAVGSGELLALNRQKMRVGGKLDPNAITAWRARILHKARVALKASPQANRTPASLDASFVRELVRLSREANGPVLAVEALSQRGVILVFERHLHSTHLDGAAMLLDGQVPVIGMTLRLDRLDNFWFVLLHECAHIICHRDDLEAGFFDDESAPAADTVEIEADAFASNALIPDEVWNNSFVRFTNSPEAIDSFASRQGIAAAIVAGRIRNERRNFKVFSNLVGQGEVKRNLIEAKLLDG